MLEAFDWLELPLKLRDAGASKLNECLEVPGENE
jgi:hypothetical protein